MGKRPQGSGTVYKLSGKREKPWIARTLIGNELKDGKYVAIYKTIGTAKTKAAALKILEEYNTTHYNLDVNRMTFKDVYEMWKDIKFPTISQSNIKGYEASFKALHSLHNISFRDIEYYQLQKIIDDSDKQYPTLKKMKILLNQVYDFALKQQYISLNLGKLVDIKKHSKKNALKYTHTIFRANEVKLLWDNCQNDYVQMILILIYSGVRISTLLDLRKSEVCLEDNYFRILRDKTASSIRNVPIASVVKPFWENWMNKNNSEYVFTTLEGKHLIYRNYRDKYWFQVLDALDMGYHKCHDTRHTCITLLSIANVPLEHRKKIVGHSNSKQDITLDVYTHDIMELLINDINQIHNYIDKLNVID